MKKLACSLATVLAIATVGIGGVSVATAPAAHASTTYWGAIAYSPSGHRFGWSWEAASLSAAITGAKNACGYTDCVYKISWYNGCGAIAEGTNYIGYGTGATLSIAENEALSAAGSGAGITGWHCTY
ncbi:DUF4189 domain-containing protein [Nocardia sp. NPDC059240]|uniref:DUF4189 domain-containing protein n=1 Tax=Nocardia sp. NPDC059240 TaxID=3346786 RepID=UPI003677F045